MNALGSPLGIKRFYLLSLGVHTLVFSTLLTSNLQHKTADTSLDIEIVESVRSELGQKLSESKVEPQNSKNLLHQQTGSESSSDAR